MEGEPDRSTEKRQRIGACFPPARMVVADPCTAEITTAEIESPAMRAKQTRVASQCEADQAQLRVHVESGGDHGAAVWLGINGNPELVATRAAAVLSELRRQIAAAGQRLDLVVCNGIAIHVPAAISMKEST
jgi:hypothetical protein